MLTSISGAKNVLEIGTFTGYSALCFAEGLKSTRRKNDPEVLQNEVELEFEKELLNENLESTVNSENQFSSGEADEILVEVAETSSENILENNMEIVITSRKRRENDRRQKIEKKIANNVKDLEEKKMEKKIVEEKNEKTRKELSLTSKERREIEKRNKIIGKIAIRKQELNRKKSEKVSENLIEIKNTKLNLEKSLIDNREDNSILSVLVKGLNSPKKLLKVEEMKEKKHLQEEKLNTVRGSVVTCEMDSTAAAVALSHFQQSDYKDNVRLF